MATKIIKALIDGVVQEIEVEDIISPEQMLSPEERLDVLEDKHEVVITDGNLLVGNGTTDLEEMTPEEVLSHINGASVMTLTTEEFEALGEEENNANTLYMLTDSDERADWNQSDETAIDYIKNRTHYTEEFLTILLDSFEMWDEGDLYCTDSFMTDGFVVGKAYKMAINGEEFRSVVFDGESFNYLSDDGTTYCFRTNGNNLYIWTEDIAAVPTISFADFSETIRKLDNKYLDIATDDEIIEMLTQEDMIVAVSDSDGSLLSDENGDILTW